MQTRGDYAVWDVVDDLPARVIMQSIPGFYGSHSHSDGRGGGDYDVHP